MYMQYVPEHLHDFIRFDYVTCESTWSPDRTAVLDVSNIHDMIGDSKYLFCATLLYNVSKIQEWKIYRHNSGSFLWKFPDTNIKTRNLKINLVSFVYDFSMSKRSDKWYEKDLKRSTGDLLILFPILHILFKPSKNNDHDEIFSSTMFTVYLLFDRDESTKPYSVHLVSSCVRVSDEINRTKGTIPKSRRAILTNFFLHTS